MSIDICPDYGDIVSELTKENEELQARIAELKGVIEILENQQREVKNILIDKNLHIDSLYEEGYKLQQRIAELEAALTNARELVGMTPPPAFPEWIPVKEKLPNLFETVLIWAYCDCDGYDRFDLAFNSGLVWVGTQQDIEYEDVTHWMPLPQPPEVQE